MHKLTIDTPEQVSLEFPLAGVGSRFLALAVDTLIQFIGGIAVLVLGLFVFAGLKDSWRSSGTWLVALYVLIGFCLYWGYFAFFEALWKGQTPGKRHAGIRVIKETGRPITPYEAISRNLLRSIDSIPGMYAVGIVSIFLSSQNKRLGDFVAGTIVVHERNLEELKPFFNTAVEPGRLGFNVSKMTHQELELIEAFLTRRIEFPESVRLQTGHQIAEHVGTKLGIPREERPANEDFLEAVARDFRNSPLRR